MGKYVQFLLRIDPKMLKQIEIIAQDGKTSEQMRKMFDEWLNHNYPDEDVIELKIQQLKTEINKLNEFKHNINLININEQEVLKTTDQYRIEMMDGVMNMVAIQYIHNTGDDKFYKKWMKTLKFNKKDELLGYLSKIWNEHGVDGVLKHLHQSKFIKSRTKSLELKARLEQLEYEEFLKTHNINLYNEYDTGELPGSSKDYDIYKSNILNR